MATSINNDVIQEGFLCPICHTDLRSPKILLAHFQDLHSEEQDVLKSLKELVGKAKNKILKLDDKDLESFKTELTLQQKYYLEQSEPQDAGVTRSHTDYFKEVRRDRLDHRTTETNKLIIRLDRLLRSEGADRKQMAQDLVTWLDGTTVNRCPSCASSFNLTRRQHHCRLCGSIMCNSCSTFLSYHEARTIIEPLHFESTNGAVSKDESETLRICLHCINMLECRKCVQISRSIQPRICNLYDYLQNIKSEIHPKVDLYNRMYTTLTSGDTTYQLQDAQSLKQSIAKQAELLDAVSKRIATIPPDPENAKAFGLQNAIRRGTSIYIKDNLLTLPILPTPIELERIKQERIVRNVDFHTPNVRVKKVAVTTGWSPANVTTEDKPESSEDPLLEQMNIVRNYIEQAKKAHRYDEVVSLRENLKMLKDMYNQQNSS